MVSTVLVVGQGAREHALVDALRRGPSRPRVVVAPGNAGIAEDAELVAVAADDVPGLVALAVERAVELVVVGPEVPLVLGLADALRARGIPVLGPSRAAAALEGSKTFAKSVMDEAGVPTARWGSFDDEAAALAFARSLPAAVVKADGLAAGKGVVVASDLAEAEAAIRAALGGAFGAAGRRVLIEERLEGEELSVLALTDGEALAVLAPSQDHKRVFEGDRGPNTGGMGAYAPAPLGTPALLEEVKARCLVPVLEVMKRRGAPFSGVLYAGLMLTAEGPKVLEYNVRFGDPEAEAILPRLVGDPFSLFLDVARGRLDPAAVAFAPSAVVTVVLAAPGYPEAPCVGDPIRGLDEARAVPGVRVFHGGTARRGEVLVTAGGRVLAVTGQGPDLEAAARAAYRAAGCLSWPGLHYRRDIAHRALGTAIGHQVDAELAASGAGPARQG
jgi:phosphoribosylamine--glycine ligase